MAAAMSHKRGFGLLEIVASMIILALVSTSIMMLHYGNRSAALRIQLRNEATEIGQNVLDSLSALGLSRISPIYDMEVLGSERALATGTRLRHSYVVNARIDNNTVDQRVSIDGANYGDVVTVSAQVYVEVAFPVGKSTQKIQLGTVVK